MHRHQPNLLPKRHRATKLRLLQVATGAAVVASASMVWALVMGGSPHASQTASISGSVSEPSSSPTLSAHTQQAPKSLSAGPAYGVSATADPNGIRYFDDLGRALSADARTGTTAVISATTITGFMDGWWLPGAQQAVVQSQKGTGSEFRWHDFGDGQTTVLGTANALAVSRDGRSIAFIAPQDDHAAVFTSAADGSARHAVLQTRVDDAVLSWPRSDALALTSRRPDQTGWDLTLVGLDGTLTPVLTGKENLATAWSRDGSRVLYSAFISTQGVELFMRDIASGVDVPLGLATSADKCAWAPDGTRFVCGVPVRAGLTADVPAAKTATVDSIVSVDASTGASQTLWTPPSGTLMGIIDPVITTSGNRFAFTNLFDHRLYAVPLGD